MLDLDSLDFDRTGGLVTVVAQDATTGAVLMVAHADREALERTIATGEMHYRSRTRGLWHKGATSGNVQRVVALAADCDGDAVLALVRPAGPACHTGMTSCFGDAALRAGALSALDATIAARWGGAGRGTSAGEESGAVVRGVGAEVSGMRMQEPVVAEQVPESGVTEPEATVPGATDRAATEPGPRGAPPEPQDRANHASDRHHPSANRIIPAQLAQSPAPSTQPTPTVPSTPPPAAPSYTRRLLADRNLRLKKLGEEAAELVLACADRDRPRAAEEAADLLYHTLVALRSLDLGLDDVLAVLEARAG
ncbi:MAG TPA: phosphoribosyl-ATP diphosphatase [Gemmatimonadales bacterium]